MKRRTLAAVLVCAFFTGICVAEVRAERKDGDFEKEGFILVAATTQADQIRAIKKDAEIQESLDRVKTYIERAKDARGRGNPYLAEIELDRAAELLSDCEVTPEENPILAQRWNSLLDAVEAEYQRVLSKVSYPSADTPVSNLLGRYNQLKSREISTFIYNKRLETRIQQIISQCDIEIEYNSRVKRCISVFQTSLRKPFTKWLARSGKYIDLAKEVFKAKNLPLDLAYLALVESGFNPKAFSRAGASGMWQFIEGTGRMYGLRKTPWIDESRDPYKSTLAAAEHLKDLYRKYGDWKLVMAAYNCGAGRVDREIKRSGTTNYWDFRLSKETSDYVPFFMATVLIAKDPEIFGFGDIEFEEPFVFDIVTLDQPVNLVSVASSLFCTVDDLKQLNPELRKSVTPPSEQNYSLRVPVGKGNDVRRELPEIAAKNKVPTRSEESNYKVRRGETLYRIARKFGTSVQELVQANSILKWKHIRAGMSLIIPSAAIAEEDNSSVTVAKPQNRYVSKPVVTTYKTTHLVRRGETLDRIAHKYGVKVAELKKWNKIKGKRNKLRSGERLVIWQHKTKYEADVATQEKERNTPVPAAKDFYTVKKGDTPKQIAQKFSVSISNLLKWNNLKENEKIYPGERLFILKPGKSQRYTEKSGSEGKVRAEKLNVEDSKTEETSGTRTDYRVKKGDNLFNIAKRLGVDTNDLIKWNNLDASGKIRVGDRLVVNPAKTSSGKTLSSASSQKKADAKLESATSSHESQPEKTEYVVKKGDTVQAIARRFGVNPKDILKLNGLKSAKRLQVGKRLTLYKAEENSDESSDERITSKSKKPSHVVKVSRKPQKQRIQYSVKRGDTLGYIATKFGVSVSELRKWNRLSKKHKLLPGQKLTVMTFDKKFSKSNSRKLSTIQGQTKSYTVQRGETQILD